MSLLPVASASLRRERRSARRTTGAAPAAEARAAGTLAAMTTGESGRVVAVVAEHDPAGARRLFDLGFVPGAEVRMVRRAPLADPVVFRVAGYEIALRREQASWVSVAVPS